MCKREKYVFSFFFLPFVGPVHIISCAILSNVNCPAFLNSKCVSSLGMGFFVGHITFAYFLRNHGNLSILIFPVVFSHQKKQRVVISTCKDSKR